LFHSGLRISIHLLLYCELSEANLLKQKKFAALLEGLLGIFCFESYFTSIIELHFLFWQLVHGKETIVLSKQDFYPYFYWGDL
jgi:hypothetical protein